MDALPFTTLADGRFQVTRLVGEGGMGVVYEAFDREQRAPIALKMMRSSSGESTLRLKTEFRSLRDLRHPGLVRLGELFVERSGCFFTMELVEGVDLLEHVWNHRAWPRKSRSKTTVTTKRPTGPSERTVWDADTLRLEVLFDEPKLRAALRQVAEALVALHAAGKVHRDVKPNNVLVTPQGRAVLLDFGLAVDHGDAIAQGLIEGTIEYMAPEQAAGAPAQAPADLYAVGAVLYEALTGRPPFTGDPLEIITNKRTFDPLAPSLMFAGTPPDLEELCMKLLARDPAARPSAGVLASALGDGTQTITQRFGKVDPAPETIFVGRTAELAALHQAFDDARDRPIAVLVSGESGLGKSALMRQFAQEVRAREDALVFSGRCHAHESIPFRAFDGVADALSRYLLALPPQERNELLPSDTQGLARLFRVFERLSPPDHGSSFGGPGSGPPNGSATRGGADVRARRRRAFAALHELLSNLAERGPLALVIDDLQWFDSDSQLLFEGVLGQAPPPLLLVGMVRPVRRPVEALRAGILSLGVELRELTLPRLSETECAELARDLLPGGDPQTAARIAAACRGSPLFLEQMIASVGSGNDVAGTLEEVVWGRLGLLDPNVRAVLDLVCVADVAVDRATIARAAGVQRTELATAVSQLEELRLVRTTGARRQDLIEPYHDQVRQATRARLTPEQLMRRHRLLAEVLEKRSAPPWLVFHHWLLAGDPERAVPHAIEAAVGSQHELAARRVAKLCETALDLLPPDHPARRHLCRALAVALTNAGRGVDAAAWYLDAAAMAEGNEALELRRLAGDHLLRSGRLDEGLPVLREVLAEVGVKLPETPRQALTSLVWRRAKLKLRSIRKTTHDDDRARVRCDVCLSTGTTLAVVDTIAGASLHAQAMLDALAIGDPVRLAHALAMEIGYSAIDGTRAAARTQKIVADAERAADAAGTPLARAMVAWMRGMVAFLDGRYRLAQSLLDGAARSFAETCPGHVWEQSQAELFAAWSVSHLGELKDLANRIAEIERVARWHDDRYTATLACAGNSILPPLAADRPLAARERIDTAMKTWGQDGFQIQHVLAFSGHIEIDLYAGDREDAWKRVIATWPLLERSLQLRIQHVRVFALDIRARAAIVAGGRLVDEADAAAKKLAKEGSPWASGFGLARAAAVSAARGQSREALETLHAAERALSECELALHASSARLRIASLEGNGPIERSAAWRELASQGIVKPDRWMQMFTPWPSLR
ncbi:MAG TPA: AAA family ATPase [Kofleriaceae bacterium]|nr:AAA family ATPase [Kofleriaceae bacterium]